VTAIDTRLDLDTIEALDFEYVPPCEHSEHASDINAHSGPAAVLAIAAGCSCSEPRSIYLCEGFWGWVQNDRGAIYCRCGDFWDCARDAYLSARPIGRH
jgi:hypothetical protein